MLVEARQLPMHSHENTLQSPNISQIEPEMPSQEKIQEKSNKFGASKIILGISIILIVALVGYKLYTLSYAGAGNNITDAHSKYIQNGDSSSGKDSRSGTKNSESSRASKDSSKPMGVAPTAGKSVISSNTSPTGSDGDGSGEDPNEDEDNDGEKRNKKLRDNKFSDGSTTEDDSQNSEDDDEEDSEQLEQQGMSYSSGNTLPLVGSTRP